MQAIILAAGMGKRLKDLTNDNTKCMVKVNGVTMIERMLKQLEKLHLSCIIIVVGYKKDELIEHISTIDVKTPIVYVNNEIFYKTNNIYSLYLAREYLLREDTLLLESDLIFEDSILTTLINDPYPSLALVAKYESWMDGTVVSIDQNNNIRSFLDKKQFKFEDIPSYYKTVNIYKFSKEFSNSHYVPFLAAYSKALGDNEYYEQVLKVITLLEKPEIKASVLKNELWYEIDDLQDLDIAESIFTTSPVEKLQKFQSRYGGYWRYPKLVDFCYLVNPYYPPSRLLEEIKANFERLTCEYPSGLNVNCLLAAKYFGVRKEHIVVGNGAAELIKSLMGKIKGKIGVSIPTFEEYPNRKKSEEIISFTSNNSDYSYTADDLIDYFSEKEISALVLVNPDNPSGNYIKKDDVLRISEWAKSKKIIFVIDESFIDFADTKIPETFINDEILLENPHLIVIKSISKSYGVPGFRLGLLASSDLTFMRFIKKDIAIWNINSFAEFYLQIFEKYKSDFDNGIVEFKKARNEFFEKLSQIKNFRPIPSHANYIMCELMNGKSATWLTTVLLDKHFLFIKDLSTKSGFKGEYIRIAVKRPDENNALINALNELMDDNT